jgi:hypothetical protein
VSRFHDFAVLFVALEDGDDDDVDGGHGGREHEPRVVGVGHDEPSDEAGGGAPRRLPHVLDLARLVLKLHVEGAAEVLSQIVARAGL